MAKKFNLGINTGNIKKSIPVAKVESIFNINYDELEISGQEKEELIKYENDINFHREKSIEHIIKYSKAIYEANQIFAKKGIGTFGKWLEKIGIDRDSANVAIRKYTLYLEVEQKGIEEPQKVLTLPNRALKALTGQKKDFEETEIVEVITAKNPGAKLKEIEEKKEAVKLSDTEEKKAFLMREKIRKQHLIKKLQKEIEEIENEMQKIK
ncbi:hypothetical protein EII29_09685 [Leptotrichia sp. OH3620_COT-345]|uniref:hypothetical protein n=1 Tax=Leptotrichia sp. OH3620_COT-345 TaxID=2491048 RepID=UPI000F64F7EA|nr:hypothetical protein [Leptotrichia sp. OH3620_COT-345]RRD38786.1 hypothetical protein EII29_09685 [Leptotrichia sp. OH3620_COT-345]